MPANRILLVVTGLLTALLLQTTVLARLSFLKVRPDLVLVVVVCFALIDGPGVGMVTGFCAGLLSDLLSDHVLGLSALVLCVVGYAAGMIRSYLDRLATTTPMLFVGAATAVATLMYAGLALVLGDPRISAPDVAQTLVLASLYDVVLTPFVFSVVTVLTRRTDPERW